jgi:hypothetical protein
MKRLLIVIVMCLVMLGAMSFNMTANDVLPTARPLPTYLPTPIITEVPPFGLFKLSFPIMYKMQYPAMGDASVSGVLNDSDGLGVDYIVWLAEVWKIGDSYIWMLDMARSPAICSDGEFTLPRVKPFMYVFLIGDPYTGTYQVIQEIVYVSPKATLNVGEIHIDTMIKSCKHIEGIDHVEGIVSGELK